MSCGAAWSSRRGGLPAQDGRCAPSGRCARGGLARDRQAGLRRDYVFPIVGWLLTALRLSAVELPPSSPSGPRSCSEHARCLARAGCCAAFPDPSTPRPAGEWSLGGHRRREVSGRALPGRKRAGRVSPGARYELLSPCSPGAGPTLLRASGSTDDEEHGRRALAAMARTSPSAKCCRRALGTRDPAQGLSASPTVALLNRFDQVLKVGHTITTSLSREAVFAAACERR